MSNSINKVSVTSLCDSQAVSAINNEISQEGLLQQISTWVREEDNRLKNNPELTLDDVRDILLKLLELSEKLAKQLNNDQIVNNIQRYEHKLDLAENQKNTANDHRINGIVIGMGSIISQTVSTMKKLGVTKLKDRDLKQGKVENLTTQQIENLTAQKQQDRYAKIQGLESVTKSANDLAANGNQIITNNRELRDKKFDATIQHDEKNDELIAQMISNIYALLDKTLNSCDALVKAQAASNR